jgi:hypothetical protein
LLSKEDEIKLEQYRRCSEDLRHYDRGIWQMSSVAATLAGIILGIAFTYLHGVVRTALILIGSATILALTITATKYYLFSVARATFGHLIENDFGVRSVPVRTEEVNELLAQGKISLGAPTEWFKQTRANKWLMGVMLLIGMGLLVLAFFSLLI